MITEMRLSQGEALFMHGSVVTVLRHLPGMKDHCTQMFTFCSINIIYSYVLEIINTALTGIFSLTFPYLTCTCEFPSVFENSGLHDTEKT